MQKGLGITVDDVSWSVKQKKQKILYPLSFELSPGKILGVVGPNGAGKSTLLRLLYRYYKPTTGQVKINGSVTFINVFTGLLPKLAAALVTL